MAPRAAFLTDRTATSRKSTRPSSWSPNSPTGFGNAPVKKLIALRLEQWQFQRTKAIAAQRHVPYQNLLRCWIPQGLKAEAAAHPL